MNSPTAVASDEVRLSTKNEASPWDLRRPNSLDAMRLFLAVAVVFGHSWQYLYGLNYDHPDEWVMVFTRGQGPAGHWAVDGFFTVSGLLIAASWERSRGLGDYLLRRARRIYPGYLAAALVWWMVIGYLIVRPTGGYLPFLASTVTPYRLLDLMLLRPVAVPCAASLDGLLYNKPTWTIQYEAACYWLVAALGVLGLIGGPRAMWGRRVVAVLLGLCTSWQLYMLFVAPLRLPAWVGGAPWAFGVLPVPWRGDCTRLLASFLAGATIYLWRDRIPRTRRYALLSTIALWVFAVEGTALDIIFPIAGSYLLLYIAFSPRISRRFGRITQCLGGDYSYGMYLYAGMGQMLLGCYVGPHILSPLELFLLAVPLGLVAGAASWRFVESRMLPASRAGRGERSYANSSPAVLTRQQMKSSVIEPCVVTADKGP